MSEMVESLIDVRAMLAAPELFRERAFIAGEWVEARSSNTIEVTDPATGAVIGTVPDHGEAEVISAIEMAGQAWAAWKSLRAADRAEILHRWADLILRHQRDLAAIITFGQGKPISEAVGEVAYGADYFRWYAEQAKRLYGEIIPSHLSGSRLLVLREPIGVVAAIIPWNFPSALVARKSAAALAAGCTVLLRPAEGAPYSALALAFLGKEAGIPDGVFSVLTGFPEPFSKAVFASPIVRKVTFTGSTEVGRKLMVAAAQHITRLSLELGGHAPCLVFDDADLDLAAQAAVEAKFVSTGEDCLAINRVFVHEKIYNAFCEAFTERVSRLKVANGFEPDADQGPLFNSAILNKCEAHVSDALSRGARLLTGGQRYSLGGLFYTPTVLADVGLEAQVFHQETFGPVAPITSFKDEREAVALANHSPYGLAAYLFTSDLSRSWRITEALDYSMVALNTSKMTGPPIPFGGIKYSGQGREGGHEGLEDYTELKYFCMGGLDFAFSPRGS